MNIVQKKLGLQPKPDFNQTLFYFMKEFGFNPLDETFIVDGKVIIKKGLSIPVFTAMMQELEKHYEKEKREMDKARRR